MNRNKICPEEFFFTTVITSAQKQNFVHEGNSICPETECMWTGAYSAYFSVCHAWAFQKTSVGVGFLHRIRPSGRTLHKMFGIGIFFKRCQFSLRADA